MLLLLWLHWLHKMAKVKFLKGFGGMKKGDISSNLDGILASKLVNVLKVAEYVADKLTKELKKVTKTK